MPMLVRRNGLWEVFHGTRMTMALKRLARPISAQSPTAAEKLTPSEVAEGP
jgi:hypothetical protein